DAQPKYLNSPETLVYLKSANLYGLYQTLGELRKERKMIILEGYMDVIVTQQHGVSGAVATLGTAFTPTHAKLVGRYSDNTTLLFDSDNAGRAATQRALEVLTENDITATVSALPEKTDADEFLSANGREQFLNILKTSSISPIDFMISRAASATNISSPQGKAKVVSEVLVFITKCKNDIVQREWVKTLSQKINVSEDAVWQEFQKAKKFNVSAKTTHENLEKTLTKPASLSLEETLLSFLINEKPFLAETPEHTFTDARCKLVYGYLLDGVNEAEILNKLGREDQIWFSSLTLQPIQYRIVSDVFNSLIKDLGILRLKNRLKTLENDIKNMHSGKSPQDPSKVEEYNKLIKLLKGSGK
ncbi:MAG: toprim domain-containing protein, partial [Elusimicrobia bacterium]|nr:toprim domain-containing protein [Elusimicrobiota bacterium]